MLKKSPSGALSPYYYKGGYFHGIHYGSYGDNTSPLFAMMEQEEAFLLKSPEHRRIMIDLYETTLTDAVLDRLIRHLDTISDRIIKLAIATDKASLRLLRRALKKAALPDSGRFYLCTDMEEGKTWLVSDTF